MARRRENQGEGALLFLAVIVGGPLLLISKINDAVGTPVLVIGVIAILAIGIWYHLHSKAVRLAGLRAKYSNEQIVQNILRKRYWQGQTAEMLSDSIGLPVAIDDQLLKTKKREIWKYHQSGVNRYKLRITLENDVVTGWNQKN